MEVLDRFAKGRVYRRQELLTEFGGQRQSGIATPRQHPLIFVFTGSEGHAYGYADELDDDGVFHYFGEGQSGDMKFVRGNSAIRDHARDEKELHLFERVADGEVRYVGEMVCTGFRWRQAKDKDGLDRKAIVFQLVPLAGLEVEPWDDRSSEDATLQDLAEAADADPTEEGAPKVGLRKSYARSLALKRYVRLRAAGKCEGCGKSAPFLTADGVPFLEAHHTLRRSDTGPGNRASVIALCPNCHAQVHYGKDGPAYNASLRKKLSEIEPA